MAANHIVVILACALVALLLVCVLVYVAFVRTSGKKEPNGTVGLEGVVPVETKRRGSHGIIGSPPDKVERAHKFRERARSTTIGKPDYRVSNKYKGKNIYKTLQNHPDFAAWEAKRTPSRRESEDRSSNTNSNSVWDETDIENGTTLENGSSLPHMPEVSE